MKQFAGFFLGILFVTACGGAQVVIERTIDVDAQMLRGPEKKHDKPISVCKERLCYSYFDEDVRSIKKYIVSLEERLKDCQEQIRAASP